MLRGSSQRYVRLMLLCTLITEPVRVALTDQNVSPNQTGPWTNMHEPVCFCCSSSQSDVCCTGKWRWSYFPCGEAHYLWHRGEAVVTKSPCPLCACCGALWWPQSRGWALCGSRLCDAHATSWAVHVRECRIWSVTLNVFTKTGSSSAFLSLTLSQTVERPGTLTLCVLMVFACSSSSSVAACYRVHISVFDFEWTCCALCVSLHRFRSCTKRSTWPTFRPNVDLKPTSTISQVHLCS